MPVYAFRCPKCGHKFEEFVLKVGKTVPCPRCGEEHVEHEITAPATHRGRSGGGGCGPTRGSGFR